MIYSGKVTELTVTGKTVKVELATVDGGLLLISVFGPEAEQFGQKGRTGQCVTLWCRQGRSRLFLNSWAVITPGLTDCLKDVMDRKKEEAERARRLLAGQPKQKNEVSDETRRRQIEEAHRKYPHLFQSSGELTPNPRKPLASLEDCEIPF